MWLSRATRQLEPLVIAAAAAPDAAPRQLPVLMTPAGCRRVLAQASHILGYLWLDGEGTRADTPTAIRWFRLAESCGCQDAGLVLGSLYNTGMF